MIDSSPSSTRLSGGVSFLLIDMHRYKNIYLPLGVLCAFLLSGCAQKNYKFGETLGPVQEEIAPIYTGNPLNIEGKNAPDYVNPYPAGTHEHFAATPAYPKTMKSWSDDSLLAELTKNNSKLIICLPQQRARVYVKGRVALDWPVSTGTKGHLTPTGVFRVIEKKEKHRSSRYGRFVNSSGKTIDSNADLKDGIPEGATFSAASMPYWHRFTWDGVGLHTGRVVAGRMLSHGCIRTPAAIAKKFFSYSQMYMPVYITRAVEDYQNGGKVDPLDVKYRPIPNNDYTDNLPVQVTANNTEITSHEPAHTTLP